MAKKTVGGVCDARCQLFHKEMIRNENVIRMQWFLKNQQRLIDDLREPKFVKRAREVIAESEKRKREKYVDKLIVRIGVLTIPIRIVKQTLKASHARSVGI